MVFLDSSLFIVDRVFKHDAVHPSTRAFLALLPDVSAAVPLMTLLELCAAVSLRLSTDETERWLRRFVSVYPVEVLNPFGAADGSATGWLSSYKDDVARYLARRMTLGDAVLAREADRYQAGGNRHLERQRLRGTDGSAGLDARTILEAFCLGHKLRFYARKPSRKLQ